MRIECPYDFDSCGRHCPKFTLTHYRNMCKLIQSCEECPNYEGLLSGIGCPADLGGCDKIPSIASDKSRTCSDYKPDQVDGCEHLRVENYELGTSRHCRKFGKDLYDLKDAGCPLRPTYSGESDNQGSPSRSDIRTTKTIGSDKVRREK